MRAAPLINWKDSVSHAVFEDALHGTAAAWNRPSFLLPVLPPPPRSACTTQPQLAQGRRQLTGAQSRGPAHRACVSSVSTLCLRESKMPNSIHGPQGAGGRSNKRHRHSATNPPTAPIAPVQAPGSLPEFLTVEEAAAILRCSTDTIYRHIQQGHQVAVRPFGRRLLIPASSLPFAGASPNDSPGDSNLLNLSAFADDLTN